ncbi:MAG: serine hydrolase [Phenylobacterium sp.]|nr:MAG: serine hydrolase [Phenylobacterium sp.]
MERLTRRAFAAAAGAAAVAGPGLAQAAQTDPFPADATIRAILAERIDTLKKSVGMVVGLVTPQGRRVIAHGAFDQAGGRPVDGDTVFAVGSVTKVFTGLILADMAGRGEVALDDPVAKYLPPDVKVPERNGRRITLADLATHTSSLPFWPSNLGVPPMTASYSLAQFYDFLNGLQLTREPGSAWAYSNAGSALLGHALARRAGVGYGSLFHDRIARPLGMRSTGLELSPAMRRRLAAGHDESLNPTPLWNAGVFAPAGGAASSANDLLAFLSMTLGRGQSRLEAATALMLATRRPAPAIGEQAIGWEVFEGKGEPFLNKDGVEIGYTASMLCDRAAGTGVVVLSNAVISASDLARHLLRPGLPLAKLRRLVTLPPESLDRYLGAYQARPGVVYRILKLGPQLGVQFPGLPVFPLSPVSETVFVFEQIGVEVEFQRDARGQVTGLVRRYPGLPDAVATRLAEAP